MTNAKIYQRREGSFGSSCDGTKDTGHYIATIGGLFEVWSVHDPDRLIATKATREEAEKAIADDWRAAS
jgi:hypothetical protein